MEGHNLQWIFFTFFLLNCIFYWICPSDLRRQTEGLPQNCRDAPGPRTCRELRNSRDVIRCDAQRPRQRYGRGWRGVRDDRIRRRKSSQQRVTKTSHTASRWSWRWWRRNATTWEWRWGGEKSDAVKSSRRSKNFGCKSMLCRAVLRPSGALGKTQIWGPSKQI